MSKHPITPQERKAAKEHDEALYIVWLVTSLVLLIPPATPIGIISLLLLLGHGKDEREHRR